MKEIKTLEDALTLVPEYWYLTPKVDKWKDGDEFADICSDAESKNILEVYWQSATNRSGDVVDRVGRRPIPRSVREAEAYAYLQPKCKTSGELTRILNSMSIEALKLLRKNPRPLLAWVEENRK